MLPTLVITMSNTTAGNLNHHYHHHRRQHYQHRHYHPSLSQTESLFGRQTWSIWRRTMVQTVRVVLLGGYGLPSWRRFRKGCSVGTTRRSSTRLKMPRLSFMTIPLRSTTCTMIRGIKVSSERNYWAMVDWG